PVDALLFAGRRCAEIELRYVRPDRHQRLVRHDLVRLDVDRLIRHVAAARVLREALVPALGVRAPVLALPCGLVFAPVAAGRIRIDRLAATAAVAPAESAVEGARTAATK